MPVSLAILGDDRPNWRPSEFVAGRWGCEVRFTFPTAKLLKHDTPLRAPRRLRTVTGCGIKVLHDIR